MKILFIKQLFDPEPTAKSLDFALELVTRGHKVQVLTGFPSYPIGKIYEGYEQSLYQKELIEGIEVIRVPIYPSQDNNGFKRILHYLSYAISASLIGPFVVQKPDVAFVYQGAITVGIPAVIFKWFKGVPFVYDINDLWPETVQVSGMLKNKFGIKLIDKWCNFNYRQADRITVATPGFRKRLIEKSVPESKIDFVPNWSRDVFRTETLAEPLLSEIFPKSKINILYAGNLGVVQSLNVALNAMKILQDKGEKQVEFILLGDGADAERLKAYSRKLDLTNVKFLPRVNGKEVGLYLNSADILFVHLKKTELFSITIPSKILSYLRSGKPILLGLTGNSQDIISESQAGICFEPDNAKDLMEKIIYFLKMTSEDRETMGKNGILYYNKNLSIKSSSNKLIKNFEMAIKNKKSQ